jgi:hypothetical protein
VFYRFMCLRSGGADFDLVTGQRRQGRHPTQAAGRHRSRTVREVAQRDGRVEAAQLADQAGSWPGMQAVGVLDREDTDDLGRLDRAGFRRPGLGR